MKGHTHTGLGPGYEAEYNIEHMLLFVAKLSPTDEGARARDRVSARVRVRDRVKVRDRVRPSRNP